MTAHRQTRIEPHRDVERSLVWGGKSCNVSYVSSFRSTDRQKECADADV